MSESFELRVSDATEIPLRGQLVRLRVTRGSPRIKDLAVGQRLRVRAPDGQERSVRIVDHSITSGKLTQKRLDLTKEVDVIIDLEDAVVDGTPIDIGWTAHPAG